MMGKVERVRSRAKPFIANLAAYPLFVIFVGGQAHFDSNISVKSVSSKLFYDIFYVARQQSRRRS